MADQALFAYRVQLPDGSEMIRTGGADRPPTHGELADYAANNGERYLGPVDMSPAIPTGSQAQNAPAPAPAPTVAPAAAAAAPSPAPAPTLASVAKETYLPNRSLLSQGPEIVGGTLAGGLVAPVAPWAAPPAAGLGAAIGEGGRIGAERVMGWPAAEAGTPAERMGRAFVRGTTGEIISAPLRYGAQYAARTWGPAARAAEEVAPVLTREVPAGSTVARVVGEGADIAIEHLPVDDLIQNPTAIPKLLLPEAHDQLLGRWWQLNASRGGPALGEAWDALGEAGQRALAGVRFDSMSTLVNAARGGATPIAEMTMRDLMTRGGPATALWYLGHPKLAAAVGAGTYAAEAGGPALLRSPTGLGWFGQLPKLAPLASPWEWGTRAAGQYGAQRVLP